MPNFATLYQDHLTNMNTVEPTSGSNIASFFSGKTIFITGGTGFLGKFLLEKLLRSCSGIERIYILVRPKKGLTPAERIKRLYGSSLFDIVRSVNPNIASVTHAIEGDLSLPNFGLKALDEAILIEKCHIVFNVAATIRFDEPLKVAIEINVGSVEKLVHLCSKMHCLQAIVHVSTAYANCNLSHIDEIIYPSKVEPEKLLKAAEWMNESMLDLITESLLSDYPNTYTFTKGLAESYLASHATHLPLSVIRPSIIVGAWREPIAGFVDNYIGPMGLVAAYVMGGLRVYLSDVTTKLNVVPVDIVVNMMLAIAWHTGKQAKNRNHLLPFIFHCCADHHIIRNTLTLKEWVTFSTEQINLNKIGFEHCYRWPQLTITKNKYHYMVRHFFQELSVAYIADAVCRLMGRKPIVVRQVNKMKKLMQGFSFFTNKTWTFATEQSDVLRYSMRNNEVDQKVFNFDLTEMEWAEYVKNILFGIKQYLFREDMGRTINRYHQCRRLKCLHEIVSIILLGLIFFFLYCLLLTFQ